ncbi:HPF/RaiA family ribosome-associated protein [Thalassomonas sp. M1454]|uniref:HPF/RaiA family ribosome-associated protein n=1 Tax=Thalassomonas sp. M1454 TaxID=2594477 RepID=UPI00117EA999|nr:HPF/RaiA family ribosome-associated protein [Thalassomonas sp. M1454]TRX56446.1 HPF/RaiA family ribosome-associated protein [Thalassomonas sp. M1454]
MKIKVQNDLIDIDQSITEYIQRMLRLGLSKYSTNISSINFLVSRVKEQRDKDDKHCVLTITLVNRENIVAEETQPDLNFAIDRVIQKATRKITRKLLS